MRPIRSFTQSKIEKAKIENFIKKKNSVRFILLAIAVKIEGPKGLYVTIENKQ